MVILALPSIWPHMEPEASRIRIMLDDSADTPRGVKKIRPHRASMTLIFVLFTGPFIMAVLLFMAVVSTTMRLRKAYNAQQGGSGYRISAAKYRPACRESAD